FDRPGRSPRSLVVAPVEVGVCDHELRRRCTPGREVLGGVRVADERRVVTPDKRTVERRTDALFSLRADDDEPPDAETGKLRIERRFLERVGIALVDVRF